MIIADIAGCSVGTSGNRRFITGLRARGGFEVDISWGQGKLLQSRIRSLAGLPCRLRIDAPVAVSCDGSDCEVSIIDDHTVEWETTAAQEFLITAT
jgi:alpha-L-fucosidase 2